MYKHTYKDINCQPRKKYEHIKINKDAIDTFEALVVIFLSVCVMPGLIDIVLTAFGV